MVPVECQSGDCLVSAISTNHQWLSSSNGCSVSASHILLSHMLVNGYCGPHYPSSDPSQAQKLVKMRAMRAMRAMRVEERARHTPRGKWMLRPGPGDW